MNTDHTSRTDMERVLLLLRRRGIWIVLCIVLAGGAAYAWASTREKEYTAHSSLLFRDPQLAQQVFGSTNITNANDPTREAATDVELVSLEVVAARTAKVLGRGWTADKVQSTVKVQGGGQSDIVTIQATDHSPRVAATIANKFARQFVDFRQQADRQKIAGAQRIVQNQLESPSFQDPAERRDLQDRAQQLRILAALQTGNVELIQEATVPTSPSAPRPRRDTLVGAALGLLLGIVLALAMERLDRRLRSAEELAGAYRLPLLGRIPDSRALRVDTGDDLPYTEAESFRMVRAALRYFKVDRQIRSVLVTSASPGEGKSTIAWNLACAAVGVYDVRPDKQMSRVLLVEADFRRPSIAPTHGLRQAPGFSELIAHDLPLTKVIQRVPVGEGQGDEIPYLDVITAGQSPPNPAALLQSSVAAQLIAMFASMYELVVIDTPPSSVVADAIPLMSQVSGIVVVGRVGMSRRDNVGRLREQLHNLDAPALGVIANGVTGGAASYYGYYGSDEGGEGRGGSGGGNGNGRRTSSRGERRPVALELDEI